VKRKQDTAGEIVRLGKKLRELNQKMRAELHKEPLPVPRGLNRKNMLRILRKSPKAKPGKTQTVPKLIEHTERDSTGREVTRYFGDPGAWLGQFSHNAPRLVEPHGAARDSAIVQMHAAGLSDQQIADAARVAVKTIERALRGKRLRPRTRRPR
jgi:hypothetical protein